MMISARLPLKDKCIQKWKCSLYLLKLILMKSLVKFGSPQDISGALQQNSIAAFSVVE